MVSCHYNSTVSHLCPLFSNMKTHAWMHRFDLNLQRYLTDFSKQMNKIHYLWRKHDKVCPTFVIFWLGVQFLVVLLIPVRFCWAGHFLLSPYIRFCVSQTLPCVAPGLVQLCFLWPRFLNGFLLYLANAKPWWILWVEGKEKPGQFTKLGVLVTQICASAKGQVTWGHHWRIRPMNGKDYWNDQSWDEKKHWWEVHGGYNWSRS